MNAFVRKLAVLSVLWSLCELLMPSGGQRRAARLAVSLLVMASLVSAIGELGRGAGLPEGLSLPVLAEGVPSGAKKIAVQSAANQAWRYCEKMARKAGYLAQGQVLLRMDGALELASLVLTIPEGGVPLLEPEGLRNRLAKALDAELERVRVVLAEGADAPDGPPGEGSS